ncbi:MAG: thiamine pyrophosphate-binding protein [Fibrobacter sp.]|jgi:indolepyruvate ferredoxin oxidoreductase alpha subunit|nr:thiamine pyrophosphate-binding protein [Fibrobacter sp.]
MLSFDPNASRMLISGNEALALSMLHCKVQLATGYPGTPSTEILENFSEFGGKAQWAPNEKVAAEVALGAAFAAARSVVTMKHVGLNVASDVLYTATYSGVSGGMVWIVADDPGQASSQNEQDTRNHAKAAVCPMFEPSDSQDAYEMLKTAFEVSEKFQIPVILRMTTRVCHSKSIVRPTGGLEALTPKFVRDIASRVMVPGYSKPAARRLRKKMEDLEVWNVQNHESLVVEGSNDLGIITSGICFHHAREAAPEASILKLGMTYPLPADVIRDFVKDKKRVVVIEENDPWLAENIRALGISVEAKYDPVFRFGELDVNRVKRILAGEKTPDPEAVKGKPPALCQGCPHQSSFAVFKELDCIVAGDIGCYTLAALPPYSAMDMMIDMGASIGMGLGLRHVLPPEEARRVVSVIGDSTFVHSGITGLVEMAYNRPATGHVVVIVDNSITAMTGQQEHPGTGRKLDHSPTYKLDYTEIAKATGIDNVVEVNPVRDREAFKTVLREALSKNELSLIVAKSPCILALKSILAWEKANKEAAAKQEK